DPLRAEDVAGVALDVPHHGARGIVLLHASPVAERDQRAAAGEMLRAGAQRCRYGGGCAVGMADGAGGAVPVVGVTVGVGGGGVGPGVAVGKAFVGWRPG